MKHRFLLRMILVIGILLVGMSVTAQDSEQNVLTNPGFEGNFITIEGIQPREVAVGWLPWHLPQTSGMRDFENIQPKYEPVAPNSSRIRNGSNAQQYFSFYETHTGGIYQQVSGITPGTEVRFSIYAYIWSSNTFSDVDFSEDDGNVMVTVGIDPTGSTDPTNANIVWQVESEAYDAYRQYSVIATAQSATITVYVRSRVGEPVANTYIYLDDAVLAQTTAAQPTATPTLTSTATPADVGIVVSDTPTLTSTPTTTSVPPSATPTVTLTNTAAPTQTPTVTDSPDDPTPTPEDLAEDTATPTATTAGIVATATAIPSTGGTGTTPISSEFPGTIIHTVQRGDIVANIATLYGSTTDAIIAANNLDSNALIFVGQALIVPVRVANPPTATPPPAAVDASTGAGSPPRGNLYIVQSGDKMSTIAARYNTTVGAIAQLNGIANPDRLSVGQRIFIPIASAGTGGAVIAATSPPLVQVPPTATPYVAPVVLTHVVLPGENLYRISLRYGVSMPRLAAANGIINWNRIFAGQILVIP